MWVYMGDREYPWVIMRMIMSAHGDHEWSKATMGDYEDDHECPLVIMSDHECPWVIMNDHGSARN